MIIAWPLGAKFFHELLKVDEREAETAQRGGCRRCGERLDRADYPRKPRGLPPWAEELFARRLSLCCSRDGCRKRLTPRSVRFLGRRVYAGVVVLLASVSTLVAAGAGVPRRTARRWTAWWQTVFVASAFWRAARGRLMPPVDETRLAAALVERFVAGGRDAEQALVRVLGFVSPVTTAPSSFSRDGP